MADSKQSKAVPEALFCYQLSTHKAAVKNMYLGLLDLWEKVAGYLSEIQNPAFV